MPKFIKKFGALELVIHLKSIVMKSFYQVVCVAASILFVYLFSQSFFQPDSFVEGFGLKPSLATHVLAPRTAMFMLGFAILMFASRNLPPSKARFMICLATGLTFFGLSCMGTYEFIRGTVSSSIFIAITAECIFWISFGLILIKDWRTRTNHHQ
jgi:hypothetical protein